MPPMPRPGEHHADDIKTFVIFGAHIGNVARGKQYAEQANRDVDDEDPMPRRVGGDEASDRRT